MSVITEDRYQAIIQTIASAPPGQKIEDLFPGQPDVQDAYQRFKRSVSETLKRMDAGIVPHEDQSHVREGDVPRMKSRAFSVLGSESVRSELYHHAREGLFTTDLAVVQGMVRRTSRALLEHGIDLNDDSALLTGEDLSKEKAAYLKYTHRRDRLVNKVDAQGNVVLGPDGEPEKEVQTELIPVDERRLRVIQPLFEAADQVVQGVVNRDTSRDPKVIAPTEPGGSKHDVAGGLPLDLTLPFIDAMDSLREATEAKNDYHLFARENTQFERVARVTRELASRSVLPTEYYFRGYTKSFSDQYRFNNRAWTQSCGGAYVERLNERFHVEGTRAMATALSKDSDARIRAVGLREGFVDLRDYEDGKRDNAIDATDAVIANPNTTNEDIAWMAEYGSIAALLSIVQNDNPKILSAWRPVAVTRLCEKEEVVNPTRPGRFLIQNAGSSAVPATLMRTFVLKLWKDFEHLQKHGTPNRRAEFSRWIDQLGRRMYDKWFSGQTIDEITKNCFEADILNEELLEEGAPQTRAEAVRRAIETGGTPEERAKIDEQREFLHGNVHITDPRVLEVMLHAFRKDEQQMIRFLALYDYLNLPVRKNVVDWAKASDTLDIFELGHRLEANQIQHFDEALVVDRLDAEATVEFEMVREYARKSLEGEHKGTHGQLRSLVRGKHIDQGFMELAAYMPNRMPDVVHLVKNEDFKQTAKRVQMTLSKRLRGVPEEEAYESVHRQYYGLPSAPGEGPEVAPEDPNLQWGVGNLFTGEVEQPEKIKLPKRRRRS